MNLGEIDKMWFSMIGKALSTIKTNQSYWLRENKKGYFGPQKRGNEHISADASLGLNGRVYVRAIIMRIGV